MKRSVVRRFDRGEIGAIERTPQGFLKVPGFATRIGVFPYKAGDGTMRYELRHPDDVFAPESLETLKDAPVTIEHPPEMITPENVEKYRKGHTTGRVEVNRDLVETDLIIEDREAIDAVEKDGIRELSSGYTAELDEGEGVYNGTPYNFRQRNIRYNHVALVERGRAGPEVRLRLDSADAVQEPMPPADRATVATETAVTDGEVAVAETEEVKRIVIGGREVSLPSCIADQVQSMMDRYDEMRARLAMLEEIEMAKLGTSPTKRNDKADADISQPGVSPQVKVEQGAPDGRSSSGKVGAGDKSGAASAKGDEDEKDDADLEEKEAAKKDEDEDEKDDADPEGAGKSPLEQLKHDLDDMKSKNDAMQAKLDEYASKSIASPEKKTDSADVKRTIRARVKLERTAEKLVPHEVATKFDSMSDDEIRAAVIKAKHPKADIAGKSSIYLESRFDSIVETLDEEGSAAIQRREVGGAMLRTDAADSDPRASRLTMIKGSRDEWKSPLSASKPKP